VAYTFSGWSDGATSNPRSITITQTAATYTALFTTTNVTIGGQITLGGAVLPNVTVNLSGSRAGSTMTDANGNYTFTVPSGGTYVVTPVAAGLTFQPPQVTNNSLAANVGAESYAAAALQPPTCGALTTPINGGFNNAPYPLGTPSIPIALQATDASAVSFLLTGAGMSTSVPATQAGSAWSAAIPTGALGVGLYTVTPSAANNASSQTCSSAMAFFTIQTNVPKQPSQAQCS